MGEKIHAFKHTGRWDTNGGLVLRQLLKSRWAGTNSLAKAMRKNRDRLALLTFTALGMGARLVESGTDKLHLARTRAYVMKDGGKRNVAQKFGSSAFQRLITDATAGQADAAKKGKEGYPMKSEDASFHWEEHPLMSFSPEHGLQLPLGINLVGLRGMEQLSPERIFHMYIGTTVANINKKANTLEILFSANQQVYIPDKWPASAHKPKFWIGPVDDSKDEPVPWVDGRAVVHTSPSSVAGRALYSTVQKMPIDFRRFYDDEYTRECDAKYQERLKPDFEGMLAESTDASYQLTGKGQRSGVHLLNAVRGSVDCAGNYLSTSTPYGNGLDIYELAVWGQYIFEQDSLNSLAYNFWNNGVKKWPKPKLTEEEVAQMAEEPSQEQRNQWNQELAADLKASLKDVPAHEWEQCEVHKTIKEEVDQLLMELGDRPLVANK